MSLRLSAGDEDGRARYTDVVGELLSWRDGLLRVRKRGGQVVEVEAARLVAGKVVPAAPLPRREREGAESDHPEEDSGPSAVHQAAAAVMQGIAARSWLPSDNEQIGGWLLRAAGGFTYPANCVTPLGNPALFGGPEVAVDAAITRAEAWFADRGLPARFLVVIDSPLDRLLDARGWNCDDDSLLMTCQVAEALTALPEAHVASHLVELTEKPSPQWQRLYNGPDALSPAALDVLTSGPQPRFAQLTGQPADGAEAAALAIGRGTLDGDWVGLAAMEVHAGHRRRGYGLAILRALLLWARDERARQAFLQVQSTNLAAVALYEKLGFTPHHRYHYRER